MFLFRSKVLWCFMLTNFMITLLLESLLFLDIGRLWQPSISLGSISKPESGQMSITTFSKSLSGISFRIPDNLTLLRLLHCSDLAWFFPEWKSFPSCLELIWLDAGLWNAAKSKFYLALKFGCKSWICLNPR